MRRQNHDEKRDIVRRRAVFAAFGPVLGAALGLAVVTSACAQDGPPNVQVPMLSVNDPIFDATAATALSSAEGGRDGGVAELEPNPPADAVACRRDVACSAVVAAAAVPAPASKRPSAPSAPSGTVLPSPFDHCPLADDKGRHFSARETRDARLNDAARCCYVAFVECVRR